MQIAKTMQAPGAGYGWSVRDLAVVGGLLAAAALIDFFGFPHSPVPFLFVLPLWVAARRLAPPLVAVTAGTAVGLDAVTSIGTPTAVLAIHLASHAGIGILSYFLSIERLARERLLEAARLEVVLREDLLSVVSHDLKTPLATIVMKAALVRRVAVASELKDKLARFVDGIDAAARRMDDLIRDLLDLGSLHAGRLTVDPQPIDAVALLHEGCDLLEPLAGAKSQNLRRRPVAEGLVSCDRARILQVLSNLIGNAVKFTGGGGTITVAVVRRGAEFEFSVSDDGPGIAPEALPHVFERFWQGGPDGHRGTGLGLYIAKGIVEVHGGAIRVESEPGRGAAFYFTLPAAP